MRPVCHSSAFDGLAHAARRGANVGAMGSGMGWRARRLSRERRRSRVLDTACLWAFAILALVVIGSIARGLL